MKIMKFGGTSVGTPTNLQVVASLIREAIQKKELCGVVVSAFSGVTDGLILASQKALLGEGHYQEIIRELTNRHLYTIEQCIPPKNRGAVIASVKESLNMLEDILRGIAFLKECSPRVRDRVVSFGELLSSFILSKILQEQGVDVAFVDSRDVVRTDAAFGSAAVDLAASNRLIRERVLDTTAIPIFPGFIGGTPDGDTTTLGRGGSDLTASIVGVALHASEIEIWTDVDGVMTADPKFVPEAISIPELSYEETMELSHFGAKVIYPPTIQPACDAQIPIRIKNTLNPAFPGSVIHARPVSHAYMVTGISSIKQIALLRIEGSGMQGVSGTACRVFDALSRQDINVILITQASSEHTICFAVEPAAAPRAVSALTDEFSRELEKHLIAPIVVQDDCSIISIVGENMKQLPGISGRFFQALGRNGINVIAIAQGSSELNISAVILERDRAKALQAVHEAFFLSRHKKLHLYLLGQGLIGATLLKQLEENREHLRKNYNIDVKLQGLINTKLMQIDGREFGSNLSEFVDTIITANEPNSVFVDCSASEAVPALYTRLLNANISVVTPNKKGLAGDIALYKSFKEAEKKHGATFLYETCVGAGLPVISTLKDLLKSGDEIIEIEAVLSGTLSYIFNAMTEDVSFAAIVAKAASLGYTEPDPRDDLCGIDVARKLLILAREIGLALSLSDISVESLVPKECASCDREVFLSELAKHEGGITALHASACKEGKKLCYIGGLKDGKAGTALKVIDQSHPFFSLSGSDNIISFKTRRYHSRPLVVRGPGAGADVTAAGVFADILRVGS